MGTNTGYVANTNKKAQRPMGPKTATKPAAARGFEIDPKSIGGIVSADSLKVVQRKVNEKYKPILQAVSKLKVGQGFTLTPPAGVEMDRFRNTIQATVRKRTDGVIDGHLTFTPTEDGKLAVRLHAAKDKKGK